jgi:hypothetical protein
LLAQKLILQDSELPFSKEKDGDTKKHHRAFYNKKTEKRESNWIEDYFIL